jgi:hypothetical protein
MKNIFEQKIVGLSNGKPGFDPLGVELLSRDRSTLTLTITNNLVATLPWSSPSHITQSHLSNVSLVACEALHQLLVAVTKEQGPCSEGIINTHYHHKTSGWERWN